LRWAGGCLFALGYFSQEPEKTKIRCDSMPFSDFQALEKVSIA
jgi:hypothetical protein